MRHRVQTYLGETEITDFDILLVVKEYIVWLEIAVDDVLRVEILHTLRNLVEHSVRGNREQGSEMRKQSTRICHMKSVNGEAAS